MNKGAIEHITGRNYAFAINKDTLSLRLKAAKGDLKEVKVTYGRRFTDYEVEPGNFKKLYLIASDEVNDYFATTIYQDDPRFRYQFYLKDEENNSYWYNEKGFFKKRPRGFKGGLFEYPYINEGDIFKTPAWVRDAVFYQIFPERFYNGDQSNDPENLELWGDKPEKDSFFGGDLEGIIKKLDYIEKLGINAIYLTPIFKSASNHKYNIDDYYQIDRYFGDLETAKKLVAEAHRRNIRVVLDAVFNHCGFDFFAFKDVREKGEKSPYIDWFEIEDFPVQTTPPVNYKTFANNVVNMPKLNTANPEVKEYLLEVAKYWLKEIDIDGWRLDVADEVDHQFWREFRKCVKEVKSEAYIVGEAWHDAQEWLQGDQFDAVMNYRFTDAVLDFFAKRKIGPDRFNNLLVKNRMIYPETVNYVMLNLLDSHDTPRLLHLFTGNIKRMKLAILFQMTYLGVPMIYYGDEIGLDGGDDDSDNRRCMIWESEKQNNDLLEYYKKLINIRKRFNALRQGGIQTVIKDDVTNLYGFKRTINGESLVIILNNSPYSQGVKLNQKHINNKNRMIDCLTGKEYKCGGEMGIDLQSYQGVILY